MNRIANSVLLGVLVESGQPVSRTRLMKLLFLLRQETDIRKRAAFYDFLPYKYGPYSFFADRDLRGLMEAGLVAPASWAGSDRLTVPERSRAEAMAGYRALPGVIREQVAALVQNYAVWTDSQLVDDVYARYPSYTMLSERTGPPLPRAFARPSIYTIGYEGVSVDAFLNGLLRHRIARVLDVRSNPLSRRFGFSKNTLSSLCGRIGVEYVSLPELGIPSEQRQHLRVERRPGSFESHQRLFDCYESEMLPLHPEALAKASDLMEEKASVLVCFEADARCCHRGRLAAQLSSMTGLPVLHLRVPDE